MADFLQTVKERVVVYDGAMGTNIQKRNPTLDDYWGKENCSEVLVLSRPDIIRDIHADFFRVGCDIVETNTFGGSGIVLGEFDLRDRVREINVKAAQLAKEVAQQFSTKDRPRFVAGSMGPTTKLPSLGHIGFEAMVASYEEQAAALIEGGVDVLLIETAQDLLQAKIATIGVLEAMRKSGKRLPVTVQVTLQESGTMLLGTEIGAALTALEPFDVDAIGLNCATGPKEMNDAVRYLALNSTKEVSVLPNAGSAAERRRARGLQTVAGRPGGISQALRERLRRPHCGRLLRHNSRASESRGGRGFRRGTCQARRQARRRRIERLHHRSSRPRTQTAHRRRGNEHDHARRTFPQAGAGQKIRRHSRPGQKTGERRFAHARSVLRHRG